MDVCLGAFYVLSVTLLSKPLIQFILRFIKMLSLPVTWLPLASLATLILAVAYRVTYRIWFHPLARFPGPWYGAATSLSVAIVCLLGKEHEWQLRLARKHAKGGPWASLG